MRSNTYSTLIRVISGMLLVTFLCQDLLWADPDILSVSSGTLQIMPLSQGISGSPDPRNLIAARLVQILELEDPANLFPLIKELKRRNLELPSREKGISLVLDFSGAWYDGAGNEWRVPCYASGSGRPESAYIARIRESGLQEVTPSAGGSPATALREAQPAAPPASQTVQVPTADLPGPSGALPANRDLTDGRLMYDQDAVVAVARIPRVVWLVPLVLAAVALAAFLIWPEQCIAFAGYLIRNLFRTSGHGAHAAAVGVPLLGVAVAEALKTESPAQDEALRMIVDRHPGLRARVDAVAVECPSWFPQGKDTEARVAALLREIACAGSVEDWLRAQKDLTGPVFRYFLKKHPLLKKQIKNALYYPRWFPGDPLQTIREREAIFIGEIVEAGGMTAWARKHHASRSAVQDYVLTHKELQAKIDDRLLPEWFPGEPGQARDERVELFRVQLIEAGTVEAWAKNHGQNARTARGYIYRYPDLRALVYATTRSVTFPEWFPGKLGQTREARVEQFIREMAKGPTIAAWARKKKMAPVTVSQFLEHNPDIKKRVDALFAMPHWFPGKKTLPAEERIQLFIAQVVEAGGLAAWAKKATVNQNTVRTHVFYHPEIGERLSEARRTADMLPRWFPGKPTQPPVERLKLFMGQVARAGSVKQWARTMRKGISPSTIKSFVSSKGLGNIIWKAISLNKSLALRIQDAWPAVFDIAGTLEPAERDLPPHALILHDRFIDALLDRIEALPGRSWTDQDMECAWLAHLRRMYLPLNIDRKKRIEDAWCRMVIPPLAVSGRGVKALFDPDDVGATGSRWEAVKRDIADLETDDRGAMRRYLAKALAGSRIVDLSMMRAGLRKDLLILRNGAPFELEIVNASIEGMAPLLWVTADKFKMDGYVDDGKKLSILGVVHEERRRQEAAAARKRSASALAGSFGLAIGTVSIPHAGIAASACTASSIIVALTIFIACWVALHYTLKALWGAYGEPADPELYPAKNDILFSSWRTFITMLPLACASILTGVPLVAGTVESNGIGFDELLETARRCARAGKYADAVRYFKMAAKLIDTDKMFEEEFFYEYGAALMAAGDFAGAVEIVEKAMLTARKGSDLEGKLLHMLGACLRRQNELNKALESFERIPAAYRRGKPDLLYEWAETLVSKGLRDVDEASHTKAIPLLKEAIRIEQASLQKFLKVPRGLGKAAIEAATIKRQIEDNETIAQALLGRVYYELDQHDKACGAYGRAVALDPSVARYINLGSAQLYSARLSEAAASYEAAIALATSEAERDNKLRAYLMLAKACCALGQTDKAARCVEKARSDLASYDNPEIWQAYIALATPVLTRIAAVAGDVNGAIKIVHDAAREVEQSRTDAAWKAETTVHLYDGLMDIVLAHERGGAGRADVIRLLEETVPKITSPLSNLHINLARTYMLEGRLDDALKLLNDRQEAYPDDGYVMFNRAFAYCRKGADEDLAKAEQLADAAASLSVKFEVYGHLIKGMVRLARASRPDAADSKAELVRAKQLFDKAIGMDCRHPYLYYAAVVVHERLGKRRDAAALFEQFMGCWEERSAAFFAHLVGYFSSETHPDFAAVLSDMYTGKKTSERSRAYIAEIFRGMGLDLPAAPAEKEASPAPTVEKTAAAPKKEAVSAPAGPEVESQIRALLDEAQALKERAEFYYQIGHADSQVPSLETAGAHCAKALALAGATRNKKLAEYQTRARALARDAAASLARMRQTLPVVTRHFENALAGYRSGDFAAALEPVAAVCNLDTRVSGAFQFRRDIKDSRDAYEALKAGRWSDAADLAGRIRTGHEKFRAQYKMNGQVPQWMAETSVFADGVIAASGWFERSDAAIASGDGTAQLLRDESLPTIETLADTEPFAFVRDMLDAYKKKLDAGPREYLMRMLESGMVKEVWAQLRTREDLDVATMRAVREKAKELFAQHMEDFDRALADADIDTAASLIPALMPFAAMRNVAEERVSEAMALVDIWTRMRAAGILDNFHDKLAFVKGIAAYQDERLSEAEDLLHESGPVNDAGKDAIRAIMRNIILMQEFRAVQDSEDGWTLAESQAKRVAAVDPIVRVLGADRVYLRARIELHEWLGIYHSTYGDAEQGRSEYGEALRLIESDPVMQRVYATVADEIRTKLGSTTRAESSPVRPMSTAEERGEGTAGISTEIPTPAYRGRDLSDDEELARGFTETLLSVALQKKVVLAFSSSLGKENGRALRIIDTVQELKRDPLFARLLKDVEIVICPAQNIRNKIQDRFGDRDTAIFTFVNATEERQVKDLKGEAPVRLFYIDDARLNENIPERGRIYFPLLEVVTISLLQYRDGDTLDVIPQQLKDSIGIESITIKDSGLVFVLTLPRSERHDIDRTVAERYARLQQFLRFA